MQQAYPEALAWYVCCIFSKKAFHSKVVTGFISSPLSIYENNPESTSQPYPL